MPTLEELALRIRKLEREMNILHRSLPRMDAHRQRGKPRHTEVSAALRAVFEDDALPITPADDNWINRRADRYSGTRAGLAAWARTQVDERVAS